MKRTHFGEQKILMVFLMYVNPIVLGGILHDWQAIVGTCLMQCGSTILDM